MHSTLLGQAISFSNFLSTLIFSKEKLAVGNKQVVIKIQEIIFDALHFTIRSAEGARRTKFTKRCTFGFGLYLRPKA